MMNYRVVATLGPSSATEAHWRAMLTAGATDFRLNTAHISPESLIDWLTTLHVCLGKQPGRKVHVILDLQGSKWRLGEFEAFLPVVGQRITLRLAETCTEPNCLPVPHPDFFAAAPRADDELVLNDARLTLRIIERNPQQLTTEVLTTHNIGPHKGITFRRTAFRRETLNAGDLAIVAATKHYPFVRYAISYVKDAAEMTRYRAQLGDDLYLIAKLERPDAIVQAEEIELIADELWLCRGDLGAEMGLAAMAATTTTFSAGLHRFRKPVILAGQVLEHLTEHATPTRSEISHLHQILTQGYAGVVLSDETAIGKHPVTACRAAAMFM